MATPFSSAVNAALAHLSAATGETGTYARGATSLTVTFVKGRSEVEELSPQLVSTRVENYDLIVSDYAALRTALGDPRPGDTLTTSDGLVRRVVNQGTDRACWRWMGHDRNALRIHTLLIDE